jgi:hypothetical protein
MEPDYYMDLENGHIVPNMKKPINRIAVGFYIFLLAGAISLLVWLGVTRFQA